MGIMSMRLFKLPAAARVMLGLCAALVTLAGSVMVDAADSVPLLNDTWHLVKDESDDFEDSARVLNDKLNTERRENAADKFGRQAKPTGSNRFQNQLDATEEMIREDMRAVDWSGSDDQRRILEAKTIKLYQGRKVVILYDGVQKRLLSVNPAGRAYSVSGTELTTDSLGRSLTFFDDGALVIETTVQNGGKLIETYRLAATEARMSQQLSVQERPGGPILEMTRLFERAP